MRVAKEMAEQFDNMAAFPRGEGTIKVVSTFYIENINGSLHDFMLNMFTVIFWLFE